MAQNQKLLLLIAIVLVAVVAAGALGAISWAVAGNIFLGAVLFSFISRAVASSRKASGDQKRGAQ